MREALHKLRFRARRVTHRPLPREDLERFWSDPDAGNQPADYLEVGAESSEFLVALLERHDASRGPVLELGCNAGRNLKHLHDGGWTELAAIELNAGALELLTERNPEVAESATLMQGTLEERLPELADDSFQTVFSMAVLEHLHFDSDWVFDHVARVARGLVVTIENEEDVSERTFPRDYRAVFEPLGLRQVDEVRDPPGFGGERNGFVARVFTR